MAAPELVLRYAQPSRLTRADGAHRLHVTASDEGPELLFEGTMLRPGVAARMLGTVSRVVTERFDVHDTGRWLDPVVTVGRRDLRFEGFSSCAGVHALAVFRPDSHDGGLRSVGTTNVDFGSDVQGALAAIRASDRLQLRVGAEAVEIATDQASHVERRVPLPERWTRSFLEVQAIQAELPAAFEVSGADAVRLLRSLRGGSATSRAFWITRRGRSLRLAARSTNGALRVAGPHRLRMLEGVIDSAERVRFLGDEDGAALGVVVDFGDAHLTLTLSREVWRGFSGEGATLEDLAGREQALDTRVRAALQFGETIDVGETAAALGIERETLLGSLARLARTGAVGFDLRSGAFYRRELPFDIDRIRRHQPRLTRAQALVDEGAVRRRGREPGSFEVTGSRVTHRVSLRGDGGFSCTCAWHARHSGDRGPCAHVLAARIVEGMP